MSPPIELRQRSPLGAPYRTPLDAFGPGAAAPVELYDWEVSSADNPLLNPEGINASCQGGNNQVPYTWYNTIILAIGAEFVPRTAGQGQIILTGAISGAQIIWNGPPQCSTSSTDSLLLSHPDEFKPYYQFSGDSTRYNAIGTNTVNTLGFIFQEGVTVSVPQ